MEANERHAYVYGGISWQAFMDYATKVTNEQTDLSCYVHNHRYVMHALVPKGCNEGCKIVRKGKVAKVLETPVESVAASSEGE